MEDINRLKIVLVEKKKTGKWLAEQLGKDPSTVSKWCTNVSQPDLSTLSKIAKLLGVDRRELINKSK
jgi:transcriptional regulator with XRE-family HTH domain